MADHGWCVLCGENADHIRYWRPVCNYHRSMIDGGYTIAEIEDEEREEIDPSTLEQTLKAMGKPYYAGAITLDNITGIIDNLEAQAAQQPAASDQDAGAGDAEKPTYEQLQAEYARLRAVLAADDPNGYSGLLDTLDGQIKRLERERDAMKAALRRFAGEWEAYQLYVEANNGRGDVGNYLTNYRDLDAIMDACERAAKVLREHASQHAADADGRAG